MSRKDQLPLSLVTFKTAIGWMGILGSGRMVWQLTLGHATSDDASAALGCGDAEPGEWNPGLICRLEDYALGSPVDFSDVRIARTGGTDFQDRVLRTCRGIAYGQTWTYGELAARVGYPGSARAVGNCMARNRVPLIVPCHRVVAAGGRLGGYTAPGGTCLKRKLLELEAAGQASSGKPPGLRG